MNKALKIKCPQCELQFLYYSSEFRPFCSEKCKMIDLGHWFQESYKVPVKESNNLENEESIEEESSDQE